ncbi:hypothetical protein ACU4GD_29175 [Cupriavidus basilensis]
MLSAIPFTPVQGARLLAADAGARRSPACKPRWRWRSKASCHPCMCSSRTSMRPR